MESQGIIKAAGSKIGRSGMQREMAQFVVPCPDLSRCDKCPPYTLARCMGGDCQLAYVSVGLTGEGALLADGYHTDSGGLIDGDEDRSIWCAAVANESTSHFRAAGIAAS